MAKARPRTGRYLRVTHPASGVIHTETMDVDPDQAAKWLEGLKEAQAAGRIRQRKVTANTVELYAHDIKNGRWKYTGESIKFDSNGDLLDGQHRLSAIVMAKKPIRVDIVVGLDPDARHYMDIGKKRSVADMLTMDGHRYAGHLGAVARLALVVQLGGGSTGGKAAYKNISTADVLAWVNKHQKAVEPFVKFGVLHQKDFAPITASTIAFAYYSLAQANPRKAQEFFEKWASQLGWTENEPFAAMTKRARRSKEFNERVDSLTWVNMITRGWNAWRKGESFGKTPIRGPRYNRIPEPVR